MHIGMKNTKAVRRVRKSRFENPQLAIELELCALNDIALQL
jgi:hypothetical protein